MRKRLLSFIKHPIIVTCGIMAVTVMVALFGVSYFAVRLFGGIAATFTGDPYIASGSEAQKYIEKYVGMTLQDGTDFYYYFSNGPGEWHSQMRFTISPTRVDQLLSSSRFCFGTQLTPSPTIYFNTPQIPSEYVAQTLTPMPAQVMSTALPTLDYMWMTPPAGHAYAGNTCSGERAVYNYLLIDQSNPQRWTVWIQGYHS